MPTFDFRPLVQAFNMAGSAPITAWRYEPANATYVDGVLQPNASLYTQITIPNGRHTLMPAPKDYVDKLPEGERQRSRKLVWVEGTLVLRTIKALTFTKPDLVRDESTGLVYEAEDEWPHGQQSGICGVVLVRIDDVVTLPRT